MKQGKKYIAVDTWNGEGYSSDNGVEIGIFDTKKEADTYCKSFAYGHSVFSSVEKVDNGYEFTDDDDDDRGDYAFATEDGVFYSAVGDYDFQYRRINS